MSSCIKVQREVGCVFAKEGGYLCYFRCFILVFHVQSILTIDGVWKSTGVAHDMEMITLPVVLFPFLIFDFQ